MKRFVQEKQPSTKEQLREAIVEAWDAVTPETLKNLFASMPRRVEAVIEAKGDMIEY